METKVKRREWVKSCAIVFLSVLLVLTFFSNTIMNRSLPEVAAQYVESGAINARIRGTGSVSANEVYEVSLAQTRKIRSVLVKVGQEISAGDPLFQLESMESEELKAAQSTLESMELNYQKSLISMTNSSSTEDRQIQKLREDYEEALRIYRIYSTMDPSRIQIALNDAQADLKEMQRDAASVSSELSEAQADLSKAQAQTAELTTRINELTSEIDKMETHSAALSEAMDLLDRDRYLHEDSYDILEEYARTLDAGNTNYSVKMAAYAKDPEVLTKALNGTPPQEDVEVLAEAYNTLNASVEAVTILLDDAPDVSKEVHFERIYQAVSKQTDNERSNLERNIQILKAERAELQKDTSDISALEQLVEKLEYNAKRYTDAIAEQQAVVDNYQSASSAAASLEACEEALEDALFQASLGDTANLDLQAERDAIEVQKKLVEELTLEADGQEITANVSGIVTAIHVTAGNTAGASQAIAEITVADRGYTVAIPVTTEQARQVRVGDTAEVTNYWWGDITATLENIASDPSTMGQGKMLIFRITGDGVEAGTNLTLSIGQRSANYDSLVPNSAIRSDANGTFVLVVTAKSSPLGNRYMATRADVRVLASDDTTSAVSGLAYGDFVITTSSKPLEAGDMVRLPDNG